MAIESENRRSVLYQGTGVNTEFPFTFKIFDEEEITVVVFEQLGQVKALRLNSDYRVDLEPEQDLKPGGKVVLKSPLERGKSLRLLSNVGYVQPINLSSQGGFYPQVLNDGFDRLTILTQQLREGQAAMISLPLSADEDFDSVLPHPKGGMALGWRQDGRAIENIDLIAIVKKTVSDYLGGGNGQVPPAPIPNPNPHVPPITPPATPDAIQRGYQLLDALRTANENGDYVYLDEGEYFIQSPIKISKGNNDKVKGIIGKGRDKSIIRFGWFQVVDWDAETNLTDARLESGILVNGIDNKEFKDFAIKYEGEFYRPKNTYFGSVCCLSIQNASNSVVENVEATGANRAGILIGATSAEILKENKQVYNGTLSVDNLQAHPKNNTVKGCYAHHNRVAGILIQNQVGVRILNNTAEYNGHEKDGGTGYGISTFSGSVNVDVQIIGNTTRHNYRKGIDSHDAYDFELRNNRSEGDRFFGVAVESRGYPMRKVVIEGNTIVQDPAFRLALDDEHDSWESHRNMDYYRYTAIRIENKSQPSQAWKNQPEQVEITIKNNTISGIEWDSRGLHRVIEVRNTENAPHVRIRGEISGNRISGKSVHNLFYGKGEAGAYNGLGNFVIKNNIVDFDEIIDVPFNLSEENRVGGIGGVFEISSNQITARKDNAWVNLFNIECENRPLVKFNGNTIKIPVVTKQQFRLVSASGASKLMFEVMNNIWVTQSTAEKIKSLFITRNTVPLKNINVYNNRLNDSSGTLITFDGANNNPQSATPSDEPEPPKANPWEDHYTKPNVTVAVPVSSIKLDWASATADKVPLTGATGSVIKAGNNPPADWPGMVNTEANPKYMRSRLKSSSATAGVYPRLNISNDGVSIGSVVMPIKVISLGSSARINTGLPILGLGLNEDDADIGACGISAVKGTNANHWRLTTTARVYVDGKPYNNEDLTLGKVYVIGFSCDEAANFATFGASWNGNGQVSADILQGIEVFQRSLNANEMVSMSVEILKKVKPEVLNNSSPPGGSGQGEGSTPGEVVPPPPPTATPKSDKAFFGMGGAVHGQNTVQADAGPVVLTSVKNVEKYADPANWTGMVAADAGTKVARTLAGESKKANRYIRVDNLAVTDEKSVLIFPFKVMSGGTVGAAPIAITMQDNKAVAVANVKLAADSSGFYAIPSKGFTINNAAVKADKLLQFDKWYICKLTQDASINSIRFGTNHVANVIRNMVIGPRTEIYSGTVDTDIASHVKTAYESMASQYDIS